YWRSAIYATYTGRGWETAPMGGVKENAEGAGTSTGSASAPGRYPLVQTFRIVAKHDAALFAVGEPVIAPEGGALRSVAGGSTLLEGNLSNYQVTSWATRVSANQLEAAGEDYPAEVLLNYLQLPEDLPARVRELAARTTRGAETPYEKALRIESHLRATYPYDPYVSTPPEGRDAVDYFLFDAPGGFCTYYASAMAVMLRAEGVPARVSSGFLMGEYDREEGAYRVQGAASHTWVEVYFPGYGWVEFEPTSAFARIAYPGEAEAVPSVAPQIPPLEEFPGLKVALWTAAILAGLSLTWLVLSRLGVPGPAALWGRYQARMAAVPLSRGLYAQMRRGMVGCGVPAMPGDTPYEFLAACDVETQDFASLRKAIGLVTEVYVQAQFSPHAPEDAQVRAARRAWQATGYQRLRMAWARRRVGTRTNRR
ncbi:MAG TPA: transglutaminase domain-containing protein, partial [Anaerolineaceae bacterium]|nr:transglutaminase domain-containing protein [Anaerolineaceae bacterium]